jgi:hypothetical protein
MRGRDLWGRRSDERRYGGGGSESRAGNTRCDSLPRGGDGVIVDVQDTTREEIGRHGIEVFNKGDMKGIKHSTRSWIPEAICLGMWSIAN